MLLRAARRLAPSPRRVTPQLGASRRERWILLGPAVAFVVIMLAFPVLYTVFLSFHQWSGGLRPPEFIGLDNYTRALTDGRFWGGTLRTGYFVVMAVGMQLVLGTLVAVLFNRSFRGRSVARTFFMFPLIATPAAMALVWKMMYDPTIGVFGYLVGLVGGPQIAWTAESRYALASIAVVDTWQWTPLIMIIVLAGLAALPNEPYEAARVDGAGEVRLFFSITLPLLKPVLIVAALFRLIDAIKTFDSIMIITGGGPGYSSEILNIYAFRQALSFLHLGYGSTLLVFLTLLVVAVAVAMNRIRKRSEL